ncbi:RNA polymerase sigma factor [candidate division KSB1 bacterium]
MPPEKISDRLIDKNENDPKNNGLFKKEMRSELDMALLKLPINHREAFLLFHYHKLPVKTIGEYMNCPESTVRSYIFRAIKKLRVYLKNYQESIKE